MYDVIKVHKWFNPNVIVAHARRLIIYSLHSHTICINALKPKVLTTNSALLRKGEGGSIKKVNQNFIETYGIELSSEQLHAHYGKNQPKCQANKKRIRKEPHLFEDGIGDYLQSIKSWYQRQWTKRC